MVTGQFSDRSECFCTGRCFCKVKGVSEWHELKFRCLGPSEGESQGRSLLPCDVGEREREREKKEVITDRNVVSELHNTTWAELFAFHRGASSPLL